MSLVNFDKQRAIKTCQDTYDFAKNEEDKLIEKEIERLMNKKWRPVKVRKDAYWKAMRNYSNSNNHLSYLIKQASNILMMCSEGGNLLLLDSHDLEFVTRWEGLK